MIRNNFFITILTIRLITAALLAVSILITSTEAQGQVIVIDAANGPGTDFTNLAGVASAPDGSTVLIRTGDYPGPLTINGKSLTVQADEGAQVRVTLGIGFEFTKAQALKTVYWEAECPVNGQPAVHERQTTTAQMK